MTVTNITHKSFHSVTIIGSFCRTSSSPHCWGQNFDFCFSFVSPLCTELLQLKTNRVNKKKVQFHGKLRRKYDCNRQPEMIYKYTRYKNKGDQ